MLWLGKSTGVLIAALLAASVAGVGAQQKNNVNPGSPERKQIADALRTVVEKELNKPVVFRIDALNVQDDWAFLRGVPLQKSGRRMDYRGTRYQAMIDAGTFDDWICALLRKERGSWRLVTHEIGATDVPFVDWSDRYQAPKGIFK